MTRAGFAEQFEGRLNYFFLAHPQRANLPRGKL